MVITVLLSVDERPFVTAAVVAVPNKTGRMQSREVSKAHAHLEVI